MIKEIKNIKFNYKGKEIIDEKLQEKIDDNWKELLNKSELFHEGKILIVTDIKNNDNNYELELKQSLFSFFMYSRETKEINIQPMFSGAYIKTIDNYVVCNVSKYFINNEYEEVINLVGGMSDEKDIENNEYSCERNLKREFKEELGINIEDPKFTIKLKYLKYPSETEDKTAYPIGTIFEVKTEYTKDEIEEQFKTNTHDHETSRLIFFNKDNYKEIYNYKQKKQYIPELWERIFWQN